MSTISKSTVLMKNALTDKSPPRISPKLVEFSKLSTLIFPEFYTVYNHFYLELLRSKLDSKLPNHCYSQRTKTKKVKIYKNYSVIPSSTLPHPNARNILSTDTKKILQKYLDYLPPCNPPPLRAHSEKSSGGISPSGILILINARECLLMNWQNAAVI